MKARPRRAEREVAAHLSFFFEALHLPAVERIPVLGRTGPDITWNDFKLIVDVKSRVSVPKGVQPPEGRAAINLDLDYVAVRMKDLHKLAGMNTFGVLPNFKSVSDWMEHMHEWTLAQVPDGISALVLHRPGMSFKDATVVIKLDKEETFYDRLSHFSTIH